MEALENNPSAPSRTENRITTSNIEINFFQKYHFNGLNACITMGGLKKSFWRLLREGFKLVLETGGNSNGFHAVGYSA